jgi:hypothetical protein
VGLDGRRFAFLLHLWGAKVACDLDVLKGGIAGLEKLRM